MNAVHVVAGVARDAKARLGEDGASVAVGELVFVPQCEVEVATASGEELIVLLERLTARQARLPPAARPLPPPFDRALLAGDEFVALRVGLPVGRRRRARAPPFAELRLAELQRLWRAAEGGGAVAPGVETEAEDAAPSESESEEEPNEAYEEDLGVDEDEELDEETNRGGKGEAEGGAESEELSSESEEGESDDESDGDGDDQDFDMGDADDDDAGLEEEE